jgi:hypothetical protein
MPKSKRGKRRVAGPKKGQYRVVRKGKRKVAKHTKRSVRKPRAAKPIWLEWNWKRGNYPVK